jgi:hypothetical protein
VPEHGESRLWWTVHFHPGKGVVYEVIYKPFTATPYSEDEPYCPVRREAASHQEHLEADDDVGGA